jgi:transcription elongation factor GreA
MLYTDHDMSTVQYVSAERLEQLKQELHELKTVKRREAADRIEEAKALGDLSENAEYHEAKDAMAMLEGRIFEIETILKNARVIEQEEGTKGVVRVGSSVEVEVNGKKKTFQIVGSNEADPLTGKISNESPIGSALLGSRVGQAVEVRTPAGSSQYKILNVS